MKKVLLFLPLFFLYLTVPAQVRMCVDMPIGMMNDSSTAANGVYDISTTWTNGSTIKVKLSGGSATVRSKVEKYAHVWENYANVKFQFISSGTPDILVSFNADGNSWSHVGTDSRIFAQSNQPSMHFGWFTDNTSDDEFQRTTLHEFGHALGLLHEHQNPAGNIKWNKPVVYNYYQAMGWSIDKINQQVFSKYSVDLSNHIYDAKSIMHYPIPASFTLNNFSVGWNDELSSGDISLIKELYPGSDGSTTTTTTTTTPTNPTTTTTGAGSATITDIKTNYNVYRNNLFGMTITLSFTVKNEKGKACRASGYFYDSDGNALKDKNNSYNTTGGDVATGSDFTPAYDNAVFSNVELFIPYDELHVNNGEFKLGYRVILWDESRKELTRSGYNYFSYSKGMICSDVEADVSFDNNTYQLYIQPVFSVKNAKDNLCTACVYFYDSNNNPLTPSDGFCANFKPAYSNTSYNYGDTNDLSITVDYSSVGFPSGTNTIRYFVALFDANNKQVGTSEWYEFEFTK